MRAMTAGRTRRIAAIEKVGKCQPTASLPSAAIVVAGGKPNQLASPMPAVFQRRCSVASVAPPRTEVIGPAVLSRIHDRRVPKMRARKTEMRPMKPRKATATMMVKAS